MDKNSQSYMGKLRGNSIGSVYNLYDGGKQPNKNTNDRRYWRVSMAYIQYEDNFMGMNGPRKIKVKMPKVQNISDFDGYKLSDGEELSKFNPPIVR